MPWRRGCPSRSGPSASTTARSSWPSSSRRVPPGASASSSCRPGAQAPRHGRAGQPDPHRGVLRAHRRRDGPRLALALAPRLGDRLQHRPSPPIPRLPHPRRVPGIPGDRCVTEVPDEYMRLPGCLDWGSADARVRPRQRLARSAGFTSLSSGADTATRCAARDPWRPDRYTRTDMPVKHPATQHHLTAAEHHTQAAKSHHLAAVHHEAGDHEAAKKHATAAHASSTTAHGHSTTARDASHKS
jgi:hypothetical protein